MAFGAGAIGKSDDWRQPSRGVVLTNMLLAAGWLLFCLWIAWSKGFQRAGITETLRFSVALLALTAAAVLASTSQKRVARCLGWLCASVAACSVAGVAFATAYYQSIGSSFGKFDIYAILQSDFNESLSFFTGYLLTPGRCALSLTIVVLLLLAFWHNSVFFRSRYPLCRWRSVAMALLFVVAIVAGSGIKTVRYTFRAYNEYQSSLAEFTTAMTVIASNNREPVDKTERGELYVVIIGESENRKMMGCYNGQLSTTPWMSRVRDDDGKYIFFDNAWSGTVQTMTALQLALFDGTLITGDSFPHGNNIVSVAKQAGFKTIWLSNQKDLGPLDASIPALAQASDSFFFTPKIRNGWRGGVSYPDDILLPNISKALEDVDWNGNTLLVIHLMGNHSPYTDRYPQGFEPDMRDAQALLAQYGIGDMPERQQQVLAQYLTSIRYTDGVLERIMEQIARYDEHPVFAMYFSDHGEELSVTRSRGGGHNPATFTWDMASIPFVVWSSDGYNARYPQIARQLRDNHTKPFCNDSIYDLFLGVAHIHTDSYNSRLDISSGGYMRELATINPYGHLLPQDLAAHDESSDRGAFDGKQTLSN
jgi:glucan phosphoethanolaminetransferase (alkaline phosphatase superfamily)